MLIPIVFRPEFDIGKIYSIREQLLEGAYHPDSGRIADKVLEFERGLPEDI